jgi:hypothetical protein
LGGSSRGYLGTTQGIINPILASNQNLIMQPGPSGFLLVGFTPSGMAGAQGGSSMRYPDLWDKGEEDVEKHWFLCKGIWRSKGITYSY